MKLRTVNLGVALTALVATSVQAADHIDSPAAVGDPLADITDVYAWMDADAEHLNVIVNVSPFSGEASKFSPAVVYAVHVGSSAEYGAKQTEAQILCQFYSAEGIECWLGDEYVSGDASKVTGVSSKSGKLKVFAGLRDDPFYFELNGFRETVKAVVAAAPSLEFNTHGCPAVDEKTSAALVGQLQSGIDGAKASDTFGGANVLSLVLQVDKTLLTKGGPLLSVWAGTHTSK